MEGEMLGIPHCPAAKQAVVTRRVDLRLNVTFNVGMNLIPPADLHPDAVLIEGLGGPTAVARALGYDLPKGVQRVQNWKYRGIPPYTRLSRQDVFGPAPANDAEGQGVDRAA